MLCVCIASKSNNTFVSYLFEFFVISNASIKCMLLFLKKSFFSLNFGRAHFRLSMWFFFFHHLLVNVFFCILHSLSIFGISFSSSQLTEKKKLIDEMNSSRCVDFYFMLFFKLPQERNQQKYITRNNTKPMNCYFFSSLVSVFFSFSLLVCQFHSYDALWKKLLYSFRLLQLCGFFYISFVTLFLCFNCCL